MIYEIQLNDMARFTDNGGINLRLDQDTDASYADGNFMIYTGYPIHNYAFNTHKESIISEYAIVNRYCDPVD